MTFDKNGEFFRGAYASYTFNGVEMPLEYSGAESEFLASRETAWLGGALNCSPVYDVSGPDAAEVLTATCVNKDFSLMRPGSSKHALICNERGKMIADGVIMYKGDNEFRSYWVAPVLQYFVEKAAAEGKNVKGEWVQDEYFFQIDGPKSLQMLEEATETDLHDLKFAQNKKVKICGTDMVVHRLGMSGALAYEVHGDVKDAEVAYARLREVVEKYGGKPMGFRNYTVLNHTPAGYPNQFQHFAYDIYSGDPDFVAFAQQNCVPQMAFGSAAEDPEQLHVYPHEIGWGYLCNFDHDFPGKEALLKVREDCPRTTVTLEWDPEDIADVFASNFRGRDAVRYDNSLSKPHDVYDGSDIPIRGDLVLDVNGNTIGVATGRCFAYYERTMISLATIDKAFAKEGTEVIVLWGKPEYPKKKIRATVARFPYFNEEYRNETFDVSAIPKYDVEARKKSSIAGDYDVVLASPVGDQPGSFHYEMVDGKLTGTATAMGDTVEIYDAEWKDNTFSHKMKMKTPMGKFKVAVNGEVVGDEITGTMKAGPMKMNFVGKRK